MKTNKFTTQDQLAKKDWRDAFVESGIIKESQKDRYSSADCIKITICHTCSKYKKLCAYVSQFESGGFWINTEIYFVTSGTGSDRDATYKDALMFLGGFK